MWGVCTAGFSVCRSLNEGYLFWAINGIGLSLVIPTGQSLIADYYQVGSMICKLLRTTAESQCISGLYAPVWDIFQTKQPNKNAVSLYGVIKIGDNCQASKHILHVIANALLY